MSFNWYNDISKKIYIYTQIYARKLTLRTKAYWALPNLVHSIDSMNKYWNVLWNTYSENSLKSHFTACIQWEYLTNKFSLFMWYKLTVNKKLWFVTQIIFNLTLEMRKLKYGTGCGIRAGVISNRVFIWFVCFP